MTKRIIKAYHHFFIVLSSYLFLGLQKKIMGPVRMQEKTERTHRRNAKRIEKTIFELRGLFTKIGQMLSIMTNFLPETLTKGLEGLQDSVPPHPYEAIEKRFLEEFQKTPLEIYSTFEQTPVASASLGQVHVATLKDGTKVAVKVQYPEIDQIVRTDLRIMKRIFSILHLFFPSYGLKNVYEEIADVVARELNYKEEGKNLELLKKNLASDPHFVFPDIFWELTTGKIITLRFMEGVKVSDLASLQKMGVNLHDLSTSIIHGYCQQIFIDGVYHADPHPGNILIQSDESSFKVVLLDFGATARVSEKMRQGMTLFVEGLIKRDTKVLAAAMRDMGFVAREDSFEPFDDMVEYFYGKISNLKIENFKNIDLNQLSQLEDLVELKKMNISFKDLTHSFRVPRDWLLLERTLLLMMGLCAHLDPQLNPIEIVLPYVEKTILKNKTMSQVMVELTKEVGLSYLQLPQEIKKTLKKLNEGQVEVKIKSIEELSRRLYILGHQFFYLSLGLVSFACGLFAKSLDLLEYQHYFYYGASIMGIMLIFSIIRNRLS